MIITRALSRMLDFADEHELVIVIDDPLPRYARVLVKALTDSKNTTENTSHVMFTQNSETIYTRIAVKILTTEEISALPGKSSEDAITFPWMAVRELDTPGFGGVGITKCIVSTPFGSSSKPDITKHALRKLIVSHKNSHRGIKKTAALRWIRFSEKTSIGRVTTEIDPDARVVATVKYPVVALKVFTHDFYKNMVHQFHPSLTFTVAGFLSSDWLRVDDLHAIIDWFEKYTVDAKGGCGVQ